MTLHEQIQDAKSLLDLEFDWDESGGLPIKEEDFNKAVKFALGEYNYVNYFYNKSIITPYIDACPNGTVDVMYETVDRNCQFLINFPSGNFYGRNKKGNISIKGTYIENLEYDRWSLHEFFIFNLIDDTTQKENM